MHRSAVSNAAERVRPTRQVGTAVVAFVRVGHSDLIRIIEIVIEFDVGLLAIDPTEEAVSGEPEQVLTASALTADPTITGRVQAIADFVVVGEWHHAHELRYKSG